MIVPLRRVVLAVSLASAVAACSQQQLNSASNDVSHGAPAFFDNGVLATKVIAKLATVDASSALYLTATANGGVVTLHGKARMPAFAARFVAAAKTVSGVTAVRDDVKIDQHLPRLGRDAVGFGLTAAVRANLVGQAGVNGVAIGVFAQNGTVTLSGRVKTAALRETLVSAARGTSGVRQVVDRLTVGS